VQRGDGFFGAGSSTTAQFVDQVRVLREVLADVGRDATRFQIAKRVYIAVDDDAERARRRVAASLVDLYGDFGRSLEPVAITGSPDFCAQGMQEVVEAGAELILSPRSSTKTSRWNAWPPRSCPNCDDRAEDLDAGPPPAASSHRHSATRSMKGDEPPPHHLTTPLRT
jgi:hypothetical protein